MSAIAGASGPNTYVWEAASTRAPWADFCRVVAIYGVILIHSCAAMFYSFGEVPLVDWLAANALDSVARVSVPLFVMLSGAMLLKPGESIVMPSALLRRISKLLIPLLVWSFFYLFRTAANHNEPINWLGPLRQPAAYHLWFVYMILGVYLLLPFLQAIYEGIRSRPVLIFYFLAVWAAITCVPLYFPVPLFELIQQTTFRGFGGYFILGGLLADARQDRIPTIAWVGLYVACTMATFLLTWYCSEKAGVPCEAPLIYFTLNVMIASLAAFKAFTRMTTGPAAGVLHWISDRSLLIFFVHVLVLERVRNSVVIAPLSQALPTFFVILAISIATFVSSLFVAAAIRLIPGASRVAG